MIDKIQKSDEEWRALLEPDPYLVLRGSGTERAFNGPYWDLKSQGTYVCGACHLPLYDSATKYDSGSGWPSFWAPIEDEHVERKVDKSHGMVRTEALCARCGSHLGHIFPDGPKPTGERHCINGHALIFVPEGEELPSLVE
jgi:peptide-methionine (R)-S-oxide reductase